MGYILVGFTYKTRIILLEYTQHAYLVNIGSDIAENLEDSEMKTLKYSHIRRQNTLEESQVCETVLCSVYPLSG